MTRWVVFSAMAMACASASGQQAPSLPEIQAILREASALLPDIEETQQTTTASNISNWQLEAGDWPGALDTVHRVPKTNDSAILNYGLLGQLAKKGDWNGAVQRVSELADTSNPGVAYIAIVNALIAKGDLEHARVVAEKIRRSPDAAPRFVDALMFICAAQSAAGDAAGAAQSLREALEFVESPDSEKYRLPSARSGEYQEITRLLAYHKANTEAAVVIERLRTLVEAESDSQRKPEELGQLARSYGHVGNFDKAVTVALAIPAGELRYSALEQIAQDQAGHGDPAGARGLAEQIPERYWNSGSQATFVSELAAAGDTTGAIESAGKLEAGAVRARALAQAALRQASDKNSAAILIATLAAEEALRSNGRVESRVFEEIAVTRAEMGDIAGALLALDGLDGADRQWPVWCITEYMVEAGRKDEALALARAEKAPFARAYGLLGVASELLEQRQAAAKKHN